jgi:hypothetical protein
MSRIAQRRRGCGPDPWIMSRTNLIRSFAVAIALMATIACATRVNNVLADPSKFRNREVTISGDVRDSYSIMSRGVYRVEDSTGSLWVYSDKGVPRTGAKVKVTGTIREGFNLGNLADRLPAGMASGLVLIEREHSARD